MFKDCRDEKEVQCDILQETLVLLSPSLSVTDALSDSSSIPSQGGLICCCCPQADQSRFRLVVIAHPLVDLTGTRKNVEFIWREQHDGCHDHAMQELKDTIINSPALIPIDYASCPVFLAMDSPWRAVGRILSQECEDGQRRSSRFGLIAWNNCESRYSKPKIELYGLSRTFRVLRVHISHNLI